MGFTRLNRALTEQRKIALDTSFIFEYMPLAPENYTKVYLAGLAFAQNEDNEIDEIALKLDLERSVVMDAFLYWQERELVQINPEPLSVEYLPVIPLSKQIPKFDKAKYAAFNDQIHLLIKRPLLPNELNEYYTIMELTGLEIEAMLIIIGYCIRTKRKNPDNENEKEVDGRYIKTVAWSLVSEGYKTFERVHERLEELELYADDLKLLFKALKLKRHPDPQDRRLLSKWKKEYGFSQGTIIYTAKSLTYKEMKPLDTLLLRYSQNNLTSIKEIDAYNTAREALYDLAKSFMHTIGIYEPYAWAVDVYFGAWVKLGFEKDALHVIAAHCTSLPYGNRSLKKINDNFIEVLARKGIFEAEKVKKELAGFAQNAPAPKTFAKKTDDTVVVTEGSKNTVSRELSSEELDTMFKKVDEDDL